MRAGYSRRIADSPGSSGPTRSPRGWPAFATRFETSLRGRAPAATMPGGNAAVARDRARGDPRRAVDRDNPCDRWERYAFVDFLQRPRLPFRIMRGHRVLRFRGRRFVRTGPPPHPFFPAPTPGHAIALTECDARSQPTTLFANHGETVAASARRRGRCGVGVGAAALRRLCAIAVTGDRSHRGLPVRDPADDHDAGLTRRGRRGLRLPELLERAGRLPDGPAPPRPHHGRPGLRLSPTRLPAGRPDPALPDTGRRPGGPRLPGLGMPKPRTVRPELAL